MAHKITAGIIGAVGVLFLFNIGSDIQLGFGLVLIALSALALTRKQ